MNDTKSTHSQLTLWYIKIGNHHQQISFQELIFAHHINEQHRYLNNGEHQSINF
ncbi:MAG: hypothetical protein AAGE96_09810 [Cyanobacteria bacterium P01_G01_bin.19]